MSKKHFLTLPVVMLVALSFLLGTSEFVVVGILPEISEGFDVSLTTAGNLVSVFAFTYAIGTPFCAAAAGKFNRFCFMLCCVGIFAAANLICAVTPSYILFVIGRIVTAVVSGTAVSVSMTFSKDVASPENMAKVVAGIFSGFSIASVLGVPIASVVTNVFGWRGAFYMIAGLSAVVAAVLYKVLPRTGGPQAKSVIRQFSIFREPRIVLGVLCVFLGQAGTYTVYTYLTPIFEDELHIPSSLVSGALLLYGVAALISNVYSGRLAEKRGMKCMPVVYMLNVFCLVSMPYATQNPVTGLADLFLMGTLMYLVNSPSQMLFLTTAEEKYPSCENLASSFNSVFANLGIATGSFFGGVIVDAVGIRYTGIGGAGLSALAVICSGILAVILSHGAGSQRQKNIKGKRVMLNDI